MMNVDRNLSICTLLYPVFQSFDFQMSPAAPQSGALTHVVHFAGVQPFLPHVVLSIWVPMRRTSPIWLMRATNKQGVNVDIPNHAVH